MIAIGIFVAASLLLLYVMVGYPVLLAKYPWARKGAAKKDPGYRPTVSVVMVVHNGVAFLRQKFETLLGMDYPKDLMDIWVISDGSTDETDAIVQEYKDQNVHLVRMEKAGKPAGLNVALKHVTGEILFFTDVRQKIKPDCLRQLVGNFADPTVAAVTAGLTYLKPDGGLQSDMDLYWRYELWVRNMHSEIDSLFNTTGNLYAMRRSEVEEIEPDELADDIMIPLKAYFRGHRIIYDELAQGYDYPAQPDQEFRRRMRTLAGMWQAFVRIPKLWSSENRMWVHFFSHKFSRLMLPWLMILVYVSTLGLPGGWFRTTMLAGEALFLVLGWGDRWVLKTSQLKRLTSPARTFLLMNLAALMAVKVFWVTPQQMWAKPTKVELKGQPGQ